MNVQQKRNEIAQVAANGINEMLNTTRGAQFFGAGTKAVLADDNTVQVVTPEGTFFFNVKFQHV